MSEGMTDRYRPLRSPTYAGTNRILNPAFRYTPAGETDIRKTFARCAAYGRPEHNPQPVSNAEIVKLTRRAK